MDLVINCKIEKVLTAVSAFFVIVYISVRQPIPHCESLGIKGDAQAEG